MSKSGTRAPNRMGSIRQRSEDLWEGRYTGDDHKQHSVYAKTQKEVVAALTVALHDVDAGEWINPERMTVGEWLEIWLVDYHTGSERTVQKNRCVFKKHVVPVIGSVRLSALGPVHVNRVLSRMRKAGLAPSTIKNYMALLTAALQQAVNAKLIRENPAAGIKPGTVPPRQFHVIDRAQIPAFLAAAAETKYPHELALMLYTGLRVGEVRGLRWADVDLDAATIHVRQQLHPTSGKLERVGDPKYHEQRLLHVPPQVMDLLKRQKRRQAEQRLACENWREDALDLVFRQPSGRPHSEKSLLRAVHEAGAAIGIPELHPHDLRHSYAIAALRAGLDVKTVQHNLGHRTSSMTLDVYAAYTKDAGRQGAEMLSAYLQNIGI